MKIIIKENLEAYLEGEKINSSKKIKFNYTGDVIGRLNLITKIVKGSKVIHLGCSGSINNIPVKIKNNTWAHGVISSNSKECLGVDINKESIEFITNNTKYSNVMHGDITTNIKVITSKQWDYIFLGEVLEHIDNPVNFLMKINSIYYDSIDRIIISVPNAFRWRNFLNIFRSIEDINTDHRYWFTVYTLIKILHKANINVDDIYYTSHQGNSIKYIVKKNILKKFPGFSNNIVIVGKLNG